MKGLFRFVMTLATILCLAVSAASAAARNIIQNRA